MGIGAREFYALRFILIIIGGWLALLLLRGGFDRNQALGAFAIALLFIVFPQLWLVRKVRFRQEKIRKGLPDALDMLSVCSTAGLG